VHGGLAMASLISFIFPDANGVTAIKFRADQALFAQGDPADSVFYVRDGRVKITVLSEEGKEAVVAIHGSGDFCGEGCLGGQIVRMASAVAMTSGATVRIEKAAIVRLIHDSREFSELFTAHLLARTIRVESDLVDQLFSSSEKRLARLLLILANFGKEGRPEPIIPHISQETLADMIGTTRSRVIYFFHEQISFAGFHRLQRQLENPQLSAECRAA
jgi:CRP-like cAMP-binding protein